MHEMDGFELINEARRMHPEILTVLVSGLATAEMRVRINEKSVKGRILTKKGDIWN
jgi:hypothetical protein